MKDENKIDTLIEYLKENMVTKDYLKNSLKNFVTKEYLDKSIEQLAQSTASGFKAAREDLDNAEDRLSQKTRSHLKFS
jgi:hypothetical protein